MKYSKNNGRLDPASRNLLLVPLDDREPNLFQEVFVTVEGRDMMKLLTNDLDFFSEKYANDDVAKLAHMMGKLMVPGPGAKAYILEANNPGLEKSTGSCLMLIRNFRGVVLVFDDLQRMAIDYIIGSVKIFLQPLNLLELSLFIVQDHKLGINGK